ncbi:MAG: sugar ABC transporter permease [Clostridia bacterium]
MNDQAIRAPKHAQEGGTWSLFKSNLRDYVMYIALVVIFLIFGVMTKGLFLSPRNLSDLINQTGYVAVLAIGMTCILIIKHIDLSVGFVAGFIGALAARLLTAGWATWMVIPAMLLVGIAIGVYQGFLVARVGVPAFVTTLAGMFIFRGLLSMVTSGTGTIIVRDEAFRALSNGFVPDPFDGMVAGIHVLTLIIGLVGALIVCFVQIRARRNMKRYRFKVLSAPLFAVKLAVLVSVLCAVTWILATYKGIPWTAVIVGIVLILYNFMLNQTPFGRGIYAIGGNTEAAELSGIDVTRVTFTIFCSMSMLAALGGILYTSRLASATPAAGVGFELDAIASSYIGGVSVSGGVGKVTNTIIGALVIMSLTNGMNLLGVDISFQYVVKGVIFILAVAFDVISHRK